MPALIPEDYLPDVHARLVMYKRIANAGHAGALRELQVEMIDRFGLLPEETKNLFRITEIRLRTEPLGIRKVEASEKDGRILFGPAPNIDAEKLITLIQRRPKVFRFDGQEKLRFTLPEPALDARIRFIDELLKEIAH